MSLESVVEDIRAEAEARAEEIREEAEAEANELIAQAEADAKEMMSSAEREAERQIERERERTKSSATLEAKQERLAARRDILERVYDEVESAVVELAGERREQLTRSVFAAGLSEFDDEDSIRVYGRDGDQELLESIVTDEDRATVAGTVDCLGGVVLESDTARVRVNNTFDSILEDVWEDELKDISDKLFEA